MNIASESLPTIKSWRSAAEAVALRIYIYIYPYSMHFCLVTVWLGCYIVDQILGAFAWVRFGLDVIYIYMLIFYAFLPGYGLAQMLYS